MAENIGDNPLDNLLSAEPDEIERRADVLAVQFEHNAGWAELLLPELAGSSSQRIANARRLLSLFPDEALLTIARGFEIDDATARFEILGVLWAFIAAAPERDRELLVHAVAPYLKPGLTDMRKPERGFANPEQIELEHDYRICDETYLFLNRLLRPDFDDSYFEILDEDRRAVEVGQFARRFENLFGSPAVAARKVAGAPAPLTEITIVANFPDPYAMPNTQAERDQAKIGKWAPSRRDFMAVAAIDTPQPARAIFEVSSWLEMLSAILFLEPLRPDSSAFRAAQSVKRVNIISHGNPGLIAMRGTVDTQGNVLLNTRAQGADLLSGPIDVDAVQAASNPSLQLANGKPLALSLRDRFSPDGEIQLLACHTGMAGSILLMAELKKLFKVKIRAFSDVIAYCPQLNDTQILDRSFTAVRSCDGGSQKGFHHLMPDRSF